MKDLTVQPVPLAIYIYIIFVLTYLFYPQFALAIESRKIEKMIEDAQPLGKHTAPAFPTLR